jgi:hypothetical protein
MNEPKTTTPVSSMRLLASPHRVQLSRKKGWMLPENTVVVSRPGRWGNPYRIGKSASMFAQSVEVPNAATAVKLFEAWMNIPPLAGARDYIKTAREELKGKNLACWCPLDQPCHADVLLRLANDSSSDAPNQGRLGKPKKL